MKYIKLVVILMVAAMIMMPGSNYVYARGGGHFGGGHMGGGWSGGRMGGGGFEHGGEGEHGGDDHGQHGDHGRHNDNNNNNNSGNNVNVYGGGGDWGWGWGAADAAIAGVAIGEATQPQTVIIQQQAPAPQQTMVGAPYGTQVTVLPAGATSRNVHGTMAYQCGSVWYRPFFGSNGVYYEVVPPPPAENN